MKYLSKIRILCIVLALTMLAGSIPVLAYTDVYVTDSYNEAVNRLGDLGIINGFEDGSFRPYDTLTRAQFAKIVVCAMDKEKEAKASAVSSTFYDVNQYDWAVPYINYVSKNNIIIGYADGTFAPEQPITLAEAVTVLVRALGYAESDVGYFWPQNYVDKAASLGVSSGVYAGTNDIITRAEAAILVDNTLFTDINDSTGDKTFLENVGYKVLEDSVIVGTSDTDETLNYNEIKLSDDSIYKQYTSQNFQSASVIKYLVVNDDGDVVAAKGNYTGENGASEMQRLGYTVLTDCHIIASTSDDKTLSSNEVRTSAGVYKTSNNDITSKVGEYGTLLLDKNKNIISASTKDAPYTEYIVAEVTDDTIKYVSNNQVQTLELGSDFPIYVDYEAKKGFSSVKNEFVAGAELTMYSSGGANYDFGVLDTNAGYSVVTDSFIIATKDEDTTLSADQVVTSSGTYKVKDTNILSMVGTMGIMVLNNNKIEQFAQAATTKLAVTANKLTDNTLEYVGENGVKGTYKFDNTFVVYSDYNKSTFANTKSEITSGTDLTFYGDLTGSWTFAVIDSTTDIDPVLVTKNYAQGDTTVGGLHINTTNLTVYRDGKAASLADIEKNDVVYYNTKTNVMDVYTKKVTGIYYDAQPNKAYVSTVTVGGNDYDIATTDALRKLDASSGSYAIGDRVTLLLGKDDKVVFVTDLTDNSMYDYGVVLKTYTEIVTSGDKQGKSEIKADVFMPDGTTSTYVTDKDYKEYIGRLVKLSFADGVVSMVTQSSSKVSGTIDKSARTIGGKSLLKDASIIQLNNCEDEVSAEAELLDFDTIEQSELNSGQVITSVSANAFGDIMILFVKNVALTSYDYGMLTSVTDNSYKIMIDGTTQTFNKDRNFSVKADIPVAVKIKNGSIEDIFNLYLYKSAYTITAIDGSRILVDGTTYSLAGDVVYYSIDKNGKYSELSYNEIENAQVSSVSLYSDMSLNKNGAVKAVVVRIK